jgi:hypothetical protein
MADVIDIEVILVHETGGAVLVKAEEGADGVWLPKSQIEVDGDIGAYGEVTLPTWLAEEKGLV